MPKVTYGSTNPPPAYSNKSQPTPATPTPLVPQKSPDKQTYQPPTRYWKRNVPSEWGTYRTAKQRWTPEYQPTYWEDPRNIARHYWQIKNAPPGENVPDWIDPKSVDMAYRYMEQIQGDTDWTNWKYIHPDDPSRQWLQTLATPPLDYILTPEQFQNWNMFQLQQTSPDEWTEYQLSTLTPEQRQYFDQAREAWANKVPFEDLPTWQKITYNIQQNPIVSGAATMAPFAIAGGLSGASAGAVLGGVGAIPGAILGAGVPLALGAGLGAVSGKSPTAAELLNKLDFFAAEAEKAIGLGFQIEGALLDEETFGSLEEILNNLPAAYQAGALAYEVGAFGSERGTPQIRIGAGDEIGGRFDITNVFPTVEYAWRSLTNNHPEIVQFAGPKEVFPRLQVVTDEEGQQYAIGDTGPVELDVTGVSALVQARRELLNGAAAEDVINRYMYQFGFSGEFADLVGHMAIDPLNIMPQLTTSGVAFVGRKAGNVPLARAFENSHGLVQGWRQYGNFIRTGLAGPLDELTAAQKFIGGLTEQGIIKNLDPEYVPTNPLQRAWAAVFEMTPDAKARQYIGHGVNNISNLLDFRRGDFAAQTDLFLKLAETEPAKLATLAPFLGSPEYATIRQSMAGMIDKINDQRNIWVDTTFQRTTLNKISEILGDAPSEIIRELGDAKGADNVYQRLVNKINETNPELAASLAEDALGGTFTPENLRRVAETYTGKNPTPWHPDEAAAKLLSTYTEHAADWAVKSYGVEPSKPMMRFFDTLKRAQSVVLLGFNPSYAINNGVNNAMTRAVDGIFGYRSPTKILGDIERWGYKPYRFQAGTGAAQTLPDITGGIVGDATHVFQAGIEGEKAVRQAMYTPEGKIRKGIDALNSLGFSNKMSAWLERMESMQVIAIGLRQFMDNNWIRGKGFEEFPAPLRNALEKFGGPGTTETIYRMIESGRNRTEIMDSIFGEGVRKYDPNTVIRDVFKEFGMDTGMGRDALGPLYDDIQQALGKENTTLDDVFTTFDRARGQVDDWLDMMLANDLKTRVEQVTTQAASGGYAEVLRTFQEHELHMAELQTQHWEHLNETWAKEAEMRAAGASDNAINAMWQKANRERNQNWRRARKFERASMLGMLEGLGTEQPNVRKYAVGLDDMARRWDDYFDLIGQERATFRATKFETPELREIEYQRMVARHMEYYDTAIADVKAVQGALDEIFVDMNQVSFGDEAAGAAMVYRQTMSELADQRYQLQRAHREATEGENVSVRRKASQDFYNNQYLPYIQEMFRQEIEKSGEWARTVTGDMPRTEFTRPVAGGAPEQAPTPEPIVTPPPRRSADASEVFRVAQEYGVSSARRTPAGTYVHDSGAKTHILNIVRSIEPNITAFDEITPEIARAAFEAREQGIRSGDWNIVDGDRVSILGRGEGQVVKRMKDAKNGSPRWKVQWEDGTTSIHQGTAVSKIVEPLEGQIIEPPARTIDIQEYYAYLEEAAGNDKNLAQIIEQARRMVDEDTPFPNQTPGEYHMLEDGQKIDTNALATIENPAQPPQPYGPYAPGVIENVMQPQYSSIQQAQYWAERVRPMLDAMEQKLIASGGESFTMGGKEIPENIAAGLRNQLDGVFRDLSTHKIAATHWAEGLRDWSLLNYSDRRNFDNWIGWAYPYQFWYTRSAYQWALRAIDRPAWFANYGRIRNFMTGRMQVPGFPSRLANRIGIPAPYLPEWAGSNIWVDPVRKAIPLEEFTGPVDYFAKSKSEQERKAENLIVQMHGQGQITTQEASEAFGTKSGQIWERAMQQAEVAIQGDEAGTESWFDLIMSPALYLTLPYQLLTGQAPESPLPITRTGNALKAVTEGTPLHMVGQMLGSALAGPENLLRRAAGVSEFGEWGDYYLDRQLSNMVAEGLLTSDDAIMAMIERQGPAYEEAMRRVQLEQAFSVPGSLPLYAGLHGASWSEFSQALAFGWMPAGLFPDGELAQRGLADKYKYAREQYNMGDDKALSEFFDENPNLEARMALWDEPDERLRQFLITEVWNRYSDMSGVDKQSARADLGDLFLEGFLDDETRNYDLLDTETLAYWSNYMGGQTPLTEGTQAVMSAPDFLMDRLETAPPEEAAAVDAYRQARNQIFPNWYALQNMYFSLDEDDGSREAFMYQFPELSEYWDWNRSYKAANPIIEKYTQAPAEKDIPVTYDLSFMRDVSAGLTRQLYSHYYTGTSLTSGTLEELMHAWNTNGRPGGDFETFLEDVLRSAVAP